MCGLCEHRDRPQWPALPFVSRSLCRRGSEQPHASAPIICNHVTGGLLAATESGLHFTERTGGLFAAGTDELPELGIGLENDGFPILFGHAHEHGGRLALPSNDDPVLLGLGDEFLGMFLKVFDGGFFHNRSVVVRSAGFLRMARIYTTCSSSATS